MLEKFLNTKDNGFLCSKHVSTYPWINHKKYVILIEIERNFLRLERKCKKTSIVATQHSVMMKVTELYKMKF